jgi:hypothetical protein
MEFLTMKFIPLCRTASTFLIRYSLFVACMVPTCIGYFSTSAATTEASAHRSPPGSSPDEAPDCPQRRTLPCPGNSGISRCREGSRTNTLFPSAMTGVRSRGKPCIFRRLCNAGTFDKIPAFPSSFNIGSSNNKKSFESLAAFAESARGTERTHHLLFEIPLKSFDCFRASHPNP